MNISDLTLEEKIGQKLVVGFRCSKLQDEPQLEDLLRQGLLGGIILFKRDLQTGQSRNLIDHAQIKKLINDIKGSSKLPIFVTIDQEGGNVTRLNSSNGFTDFPSAYEIGTKGDLNSAKEIYQQVAQTLYETGFNVNFAPVLDLCINTKNQVIFARGRCFSEYPEKVATFGQIHIESHLERKILPVAKHFPGHGSSFGDTHLGWVDISTTWKQVELVPYKILSKANKLPAVMVGHLFNKNIDPIYPATFSRIWIEEVLRKQIEFNGLIFSDDLQMKAISENFSLEEVVELSFISGIDVLVFANQMEYNPNIVNEIIDIVKNLLNEGKIKISQIDKSVEKIIDYKLELMSN